MIKRHSGFTFYELMFTLVILTILTTIASASFSTTIFRQSTLNATSSLFHILQFARTEAVKRNTYVTVCPSQDFENCSNDWSTGFIVFVDPDSTGTKTPGDTILRAQQIKGNTTSINFNSSTSNNYLKYSPSGRSLARGTFDIEALPENNKFYSIVIYDSGRARIEEHG